MPSKVDFAAEGLLEGVEGEAREARRELLERLSAEGVQLEELREAVAEGRLALIPVERALAGGRRYSRREVSELTGVPVEQLDRQWKALGMAAGAEDDPLLSRDDLEAARRVRELIDAGIDPEAITELARVIAVAMSQFAAANRQMIGEGFVSPGDTELDVADRFLALAEGLIPMVGPSLEHAYKLHLREQIRHAVVDVQAIGEGRLDAAETTAIAFADLVGFTRLGEELPPEELGRVTGRFDELAREATTGPVRLVKLIGDAAMFASADADALLEAVLGLVEEAERVGEEQSFPVLRAGVAVGPVIGRGGDLYGRPVNLASRITGVARPGSVLVTAELRESVDGAYRFSNAGRKSLKGISRPVHVYRCRRPAGGAEGR